MFNVIHSFIHYIVFNCCTEVCLYLVYILLYLIVEHMYIGSMLEFRAYLAAFNCCTKVCWNSVHIIQYLIVVLTFLVIQCIYCSI